MPASEYWWAGQDNATLREPASSHESCLHLAAHRPDTFREVQLCSRLVHQREQFGGGVPIADGHILIAGKRGDPVQTALHSPAGQPGKVKSKFSCIGLINTFL